MPSSAFKLNGKTALISGDSQYWSRYAAVALAEAGANVAIAAGSEDKMKAAAAAATAAAEAADKDVRTHTVKTDCSDAASVRSAVDSVVAALGKVDILVNAANLEMSKPFLSTTEEDFRRVMDGNLMSAFHFSQAVAPGMIEQGKGRIINLISCLAERGVSNASAYCAAMGGILQLTRTLDIELASTGITSNAIGYGWMSEVEKTGAPQEELLHKYLPLKRYSHPAEVGPLLVYLASDTTDFFSGQFLYVDGAAMSHL